MKENSAIGIKEVAKRADVALATVDRVLHNRPGVSTKTKAKVLKAIEELDYHPNIMASNLSRNKKFKIGVLLPKKSKESSYWKLAPVGINKARKELKQFPIEIEDFYFDYQDGLDIKKQILRIINSNVDGLVLTPKYTNELEILLEDCKEKNIPYIFIDSDIEGKNSLCSIKQPLLESGALAAQLFSYCFQEGTILVMYYKDEMDSEDTGNKKVKGLKDYFSDNPYPITVKIQLIEKLDHKYIKEFLDKTLSSNPDIKGVFMTDSKIGQIARYIKEGKTDKIFLIGYDYLEENAKLVEEGIIDFLICQRPARQGYLAISKLFEHLVLRKEVESELIIPLDIVTKMNCKFYQLF
jgi:LacI family transcriptional regulator